MKYSGVKSYSKSFKGEGVKKADSLTTCEVVNLVPGSKYTFEVYGTTVCGNSSSAYVLVETKIKGNNNDDDDDDDYDDDDDDDDDDLI